MLMRPPSITADQNQNLSHVHTESEARKSSRSKTKTRQKQNSIAVRRNPPPQSRQPQQPQQPDNNDNRSVNSHASGRSKRTKKKQSSLGGNRGTTGYRVLSPSPRKQTEEMEVMDYLEDRKPVAVEYSEVKNDYGAYGVAVRQYQPQENRETYATENNKYSFKDAIHGTRVQEPQNFEDQIPVMKLMEHPKPYENNKNLQNVVSPKIIERQQTKRLTHLFEQKKSMQNQSSMMMSELTSENNSTLNRQSRRSRSKLGQLFKQSSKQKQARNQGQTDHGKMEPSRNYSNLKVQSKVDVGVRARDKPTTSHNYIPEKAMEASLRFEGAEGAEDQNKSELNLSQSRNIHFVLNSNPGSVISNNNNKDSLCFNLEPERKKKGLGVESKRIKQLGLSPVDVKEAEPRNKISDFTHVDGNMISRELNDRDRLKANLQLNQRMLQESGAGGYATGQYSSAQREKEEELRKKQEALREKQRQIEQQRIRMEEQRRREELRLNEERQIKRRQEQQLRRRKESLRAEEDRRKQQAVQIQRRRQEQQEKRRHEQRIRAQKQEEQLKKQVQIERERYIAQQQKLRADQRKRQQQSERMALEKQRQKQKQRQQAQMARKASIPSENSLIYQLDMQQKQKEKKTEKQTRNRFDEIPSAYARQPSSKGSDRSRNSRKSSKKKEAVIPLNQALKKKTYGQISPRAEASFYQESLAEPEEKEKIQMRQTVMAPRKLMSFNEEQDLNCQPKGESKTDSYFYDKSLKAPSSKPPLSRRSSSKSKKQGEVPKKKSKQSQIKIRSSEPQKKMTLIQLAMKKNYEPCSGSEYQSQDSFRSGENSVQSRGSRNSIGSRGSRKKQSIIRKQGSANRPPIHRRVSPEADSLKRRTTQHEREMQSQFSNTGFNTNSKNSPVYAQEKPTIIKGCSFIDQKGRLVSNGNMIVKGSRVISGVSAENAHNQVFERMLRSREKRRSQSRDRSLNRSRASSRSIEKGNSRAKVSKQFVQSEAYSQTQGRYQESGSNFYGTQQNYNSRTVQGQQNRAKYGGNHKNLAVNTLQEFMKPIEQAGIAKKQEQYQRKAKEQNRKRTLQRTQKARNY